MNSQLSYRKGVLGVVILFCTSFIGCLESTKKMISINRPFHLPNSLVSLDSNLPILPSNDSTIFLTQNGSCAVCFDKINKFHQLIVKKKIKTPINIVLTSNDNFEVFRYALKSGIIKENNFRFIIDHNGDFRKT